MNLVIKKGDHTMRKIFQLFLFFALMLGCTKDNPMNIQTEEDVELFGWMDIEYIVIAPTLPRIGRYTEPNHGEITFQHDKKNWSEIIAMPIRIGDRIILSVSLDVPGGILKTQIKAKGIIIAEGTSNSSIYLQYIF